MRNIFILFSLFIILLLSIFCYQKPPLISIFPLEKYSQVLTDWINPNQSDYNQLLLKPVLQQNRFDIFYQHFFGKLSPWDESHIKKILSQSSSSELYSLEQEIVANFTNQDKPPELIGYGENFRILAPAWIDAIRDNIAFKHLTHLTYHAENRGIALTNLAARALPTDDVYFYSHTLAGQGYPFDNLQISSLWAGTPVYIFSETKDHAWVLVLTPDYIAWVKNRGIARADNAFIKTWQQAAHKQLVAITKTKTSVLDDKKQFRFYGYIGAVFPAAASAKIMIPEADNQQHAIIQYGILPPHAMANMPMPVDRKNLANILSSLQARPYGWGNLYFYNDCSAELKNLFTPFGIWLPRHSSEQVYAGNLIDISTSSPKKRIAYLQAQGHPFMTIVYIGGHIFLYIGNYPNPNDHAHTPMVMTYQNMWGLSPNPPTRRAVIGQSVFFPLLLQFPEDRHLKSQANKKYFQISYLDEAPNYFMKLEQLDLKALMTPYFD